MYVLLKTDNNAYELFPNYVPPSPFASKSGGHDPHSSYGSAAPAYFSFIHSFIAICIERTMSRMSNQRCWRQSSGGQLLAKYYFKVPEAIE